jgi:hypothetical protein
MFIVALVLSAAKIDNYSMGYPGDFTSYIGNLAVWPYSTLAGILFGFFNRPLM